jgi:hypothetical protein
MAPPPTVTTEVISVNRKDQHGVIGPRLHQANPTNQVRAAVIRRVSARGAATITFAVTVVTRLV